MPYIISKSILPLLLLVCTASHTLAQLSGRILDENQQPLEFATVMLIKHDSTILEGTITDANGHFNMEESYQDASELQAKLLGYLDVVIPIENPNENLTIELSEVLHDLSEVTVAARKPLIQQTHDRITVNISANHATRGATALEALSVAPGVLVDQQNRTISMSGKSEALIMINDRLVRVGQSALVGQLEGISADQIDRIEIIHQPPAEYNADGNAGIIRVVLKKNQDLGWNGSASISPGYGQREKLSGNAQFNWRGQGFNLYGDYSHMLNINDEVLLQNFRSYSYQGDQYDYASKLFFDEQKRRLHTARLGLDLFISEKTTIGLLGGMSDWWHNAVNRTISDGGINGQVEDLFRFASRPFVLNSSYFGNLNVFHKLNGGSTFNFDLDYADYLLESPGTFNDQVGTSEISAIRVDRTSPLNLWTVKSDLKKPLGDRAQLAIGVKASISRLDNNALIENKIDEVWTRNSFFSADDKIVEDIYAAYTSLNTNLSDRTTLETGLRYEYFDYAVSSTNAEREIQIKRGSLFPVVRFNVQLDSTQSLQLGFNRRIVRPAFGQLATYFVFIDPSLVATGNILLRPAFSNTIKLGYQKNSLYVSAEFSSEKNHINYRNTVNKEQALQLAVQHNFDRYNLVALSASFPVYFTNWWESNNTIIAQHRWLTDEVGRPFPISHAKSNVILQSSHLFKLGSNLSINASVNYFSGFLQGDQIHQQSFRANLGIQKKFKQSSLSFAVNDLFMQAGLHRWSHVQPEEDLKTWGHNQWSERTVRLTYSVDFGNRKVKRRIRKTGSEEERKRAGS